MSYYVNRHTEVMNAHDNCLSGEYLDTHDYIRSHAYYEMSLFICFFFLAHLSHSSVRLFTPLNDLSSETPGPNFFKVHVEPYVKGGLKICQINQDGRHAHI